MVSANAAGSCLGKRDPSFGGYIYKHSSNGRHSLMGLGILGFRVEDIGQRSLTTELKKAGV